MYYILFSFQIPTCSIVDQISLLPFVIKRRKHVHIDVLISTQIIEQGFVFIVSSCPARV